MPFSSITEAVHEQMPCQNKSANLLSYQLLAGILFGGGTISGTLNNSGGWVLAGTSAEFPATITISGDYTQGACATLQVIVSGDEGWGALSVGGTATLAGDLRITIMGAAIQPGDQGTILGANNLVGAFDSTPPNWDVGYPVNTVWILNEWS